MNWYLIILVGVEDLEIKAVDQAAWDEIQNAPGDGNDKALSVKGQSFSSVLDAIKWSKDQQVEFMDEYQGSIY